MVMVLTTMTDLINITQFPVILPLKFRYMQTVYIVYHAYCIADGSKFKG